MGKRKVIVSDPGITRQALLAAREPISLDIETTGVGRTDRLVSVGLFLDGAAHILFVGSIASDVANVPLADALWALEPLARPDCPPVFGHNFGFDVFFLRRAGVAFGGPIHCTMRAVRLLDQDRGADGGDVYSSRMYREFRKGLSPRTNYKLKDLTPRLTGLQMVGKPESISTMAWLPLAEHVRYLTSDVYGTRLLYDHVMGEINRWSWRLPEYHAKYCEPLTPILIQMRLDGWTADVALIRSMVKDLDETVERLNDMHVHDYAHVITTDSDVVKWLFGKRAPSLGLPWLRTTQNASGGAKKPSLDKEHFRRLSEEFAGDESICRSLLLISELRRAQSLSSKIGSLLDHVWDDGVIRTTLTDKQATGRISSSSPNLQQVAKVATFDKIPLPGLPTVYRARDGLVARPGMTLVAMDLAQADVRVLAHMVASAKLPHRYHIRRLQEDRLIELNAQYPATKSIRNDVEHHRNHNAVRDVSPPATDLFNPAKGSRLLVDFLNSPPGTDFYTVAGKTMFGVAPTKEERHHCKQTILGLINLMGPDTLAERIGKGEPKELQAKARELMAKFKGAYTNDLVVPH